MLLTHTVDISKNTFGHITACSGTVYNQKMHTANIQTEVAEARPQCDYLQAVKGNNKTWLHNKQKLTQQDLVRNSQQHCSHGFIKLLDNMSAADQ